MQLFVLIADNLAPLIFDVNGLLLGISIRISSTIASQATLAAIINLRPMETAALSVLVNSFITPARAASLGLHTLIHFNSKNSTTEPTYLGPFTPHVVNSFYCCFCGSASYFVQHRTLLCRRKIAPLMRAISESARRTHLSAQDEIRQTRINIAKPIPQSLQRLNGLGGD